MIITKQPPPLPKLNEMKELLKQLASYKIWANQKITDLILSLPEEKQLTEVPSSFNSLHKTLLHMWDSEAAWWQRLKLQERIVIPSENFIGNLQDVVTGLLSQNRQWDDWIGNASEVSIDHVVQYYNSKKEHFK